MKSLIDGFNIFRVTGRRHLAVAESIIRQGLSLGSKRRPLRDFRVIEIKRLGGSDYFVGLRLDEVEFKELTFNTDGDIPNLS